MPIRNVESQGRVAWSTGEFAFLFALACAALLWPAVYNRFPLIFPDTGAYLDVAYGGHWTLDRSGFYGLFFQPFARPTQTALGLWLMIAAQAAIVGAVLLAVVRKLASAASPIAVGTVILAAALLTSMSFHTAQLMPDAFTAALVLCVWLAASRDLSAPGTPLLWLATVFLGLVHHTHLPLMAAVGVVTLVCAGFNVAWREIAKRLIALTLALAAITGAHVAFNGMVFGRWTVSPLGSWFLFARLHEDGLVQPWFDRHCGKDGPSELCAIRQTLPNDSQVLLWSTSSPLHSHIHQEMGSAVTWHWVNMMSQAVSGSIREQPLNFARTIAGAGTRQFVTFQTLDDECPEVCKGKTLAGARPNVTAEGSRQLRGEMPKSLIRAVQTPVAALSLALLPFFAFRAWRRGDRTAFELTAAVAAALVVNAALGGGLSDVHDRYQSRVIWIVPFIILLLELRWRGIRGAGTRP